MLSSIGRLFLIVCLVLPAFSAQQDALAIDAVIQARHLPYGAILDPVLSDDFTRLGQNRMAFAQKRQNHFIYDLARLREHRATFELRFCSIVR